MLPRLTNLVMRTYYWSFKELVEVVAIVVLLKVEVAREVSCNLQQYLSFKLRVTLEAFLVLNWFFALVYHVPLLKADR